MHNKEIARCLREAAGTFPEWCSQEANQAEWTFDGFTVRCRPTQDAVLNMSEKFRKARPHKLTNKVRPRRPSDYR